MDMGVHLNSRQCNDPISYDDNYDASCSAVKGVPLGSHENGLLRHAECLAAR